MIDSTQATFASKLMIGAECTPGGTYLRVWAPKRKRVEAVFYSPVEASVELEPQEGGYFSALVPADVAGHGARYKYRLDGGAETFPDPASHWQPDGPHEASGIIDCRDFKWTDASWGGVHLEGQILYELHVGTFSPEGNYRGVEERLHHLKDTGITVIELMPVNTFPGKFGWGYDGVQLFAPYAGYGTPDELRHLINKAHEMGLGVILDVVYNHLGPDGNYVGQYADTYFNHSVKTGWGDAINFDSAGSEGVREFVTANARYWIEEFHFDGLRLDATQAIVDNSGSPGGRYERHILEEIRIAVDEGAHGRGTIVVTENELQETRQIRPRHEGGYGLDGAWNDDLHHTLRVALTGHSPAYYVAHEGSAQELVSAARHGFLFQGQSQGAVRGHRGTSTRNLAPWRFVTFMENHDQVANSRTGARLRMLTSPGRYRAATAYLLLGPGTPMLFQGQEFGSTRPCAYFANHHKELSALVRAGRGEALSAFVAAWLMRDDQAERFPDPEAVATFEKSKLDWDEFEDHPGIVALYRDLIALRRADPIFAHCRYGTVDAAVLSDFCFVIRYWNDSGERLLVVNLGPDLFRKYMAEPLVAPPEGMDWTPIWSSEDLLYGGNGAPQFEDEEGWHVAGESAIAFRPVPLQSGRRRVSSLNGLMFQEETPGEKAE